jgi:hypothetical protein
MEAQSLYCAGSSKIWVPRGVSTCRHCYDIYLEILNFGEVVSSGDTHCAAGSLVHYWWGGGQE